MDWLVSGEAKQRLLRGMAQSKVDDNRHVAAWAEDCPPDVLTSLADDPNFSVRVGVASNPNTPPDVLHLLARDQDLNVRHAVAGNPRTPMEDLLMLAHDADRRLRELARGILFERHSMDSPSASEASRGFWDPAP